MGQKYRNCGLFEQWGRKNDGSLIQNCGSIVTMYGRKFDEPDAWQWPDFCKFLHVMYDTFFVTFILPQIFDTGHSAPARFPFCFYERIPLVARCYDMHLPCGQEGFLPAPHVYKERDPLQTRRQQGFFSCGQEGFLPAPHVYKERDPLQTRRQQGFFSCGQKAFLFTPDFLMPLERVYVCPS